MSLRLRVPSLESVKRDIEMRTAPRYPILQRCFALPARASAAEAIRGVVYNISSTGVGVTLPVRLPRGTVLCLHPWGLPEGVPLQVRVVYARPVETQYFTGCELLKRLSDAALEIWKSGSLDWPDEPVDPRATATR